MILSQLYQYLGRLKDKLLKIGGKYEDWLIDNAH